MKTKHMMVAALLCLPPCIASAGVTIEITERNAAGASAGVQTIQAQDGMARIEARSGTVILFRDDALYQLDVPARRYRVMDKRSLEAMSSRMNAAMTQMQAELARMPPEQRAMVERMMGAQMGPAGAAPAPADAIQAVDTGRGDRVGGRDCRIWNLLRNGRIDREICAAPFASLPGAGDMKQTFARMAALFEGLRMPAVQSHAAPAFEAIDRIDGFPIRTREYAAGVPNGVEHVVTAWKAQALPAQMFAIPPGYTQQAIMPGAREP
ncbi:MAG: DUF4412 domain-containing protein [Gammaproteobacteria bacterium]